MKKKIKDLTFFDLTDICIKYIKCSSCPLRITYDKDTACITSLLYHNTQGFDWPRIIEQEVEI